MPPIESFVFGALHKELGGSAYLPGWDGSLFFNLVNFKLYADQGCTQAGDPFCEASIRLTLMKERENPLPKEKKKMKMKMIQKKKKIRSFVHP